MQEKTIKEILEHYKLNNLKSEYFIKELLNELSKYSKNDYINPKKLRLVYRADKDYVYAVLDACVKENLLEISINLQCCRCGRIVKLNKYFERDEEYVCEECGADNNQTDYIRGYIVL